jgi:hypothetical protein
MAGVLVFILIGAVVIVAAYLSYYMKKKRRDETAAMAKQLGLTYSPVDLEGLLGYPFQLFERGDGRGCENVMSGTWQELPLREFDYWYYEESTDSEGHNSKTYYRFSCVLAGIAANCSALTVGHENVLTHMASHIGFPDIDFELEDFNKEFRVKSPDRKFANDFIDQRMMQWMLQAGNQFSYEVVANEVLVISKKRKPEELIPLLGTVKEFLDHVPKVVYELYGSASPQ